VIVTVTVLALACQKRKATTNSLSTHPSGGKDSINTP